ncbi:MAG TPA: hypothetical protein VFJ85_08975 [Acidimicrobiales bacterium]|nr:hypothetical protein [Acidimicrobiales bacterium]
MRATRWRSSWLLVAVLVAACGGTSAAVRAWDDEVTGVVAQVNDAMSRQVVPALLAVGRAGGAPDLKPVDEACGRLAGAVALFQPLAADPPKGRAGTAAKVARLQHSLEPIASDCQASVAAGDVDALVAAGQGLGAKLVTASGLERGIAAELHHGAACPKRLRATVRTCKKAK